MAVKSAKKKVSGPKNSKSANRLKKSRGSRSAVIGMMGAVVAILLIFEGVSLFKTPEVEAVLTAQVIGQFSGADQPCGKFAAWDVAVAGDDRIAVTDQQNGRILFFDHTGKYLKTWGKKGEGIDDLKEPSGLTAGTKGNIYFIDAWKSAIMELDSKDKLGLTVPLTRGFYGPRGVAYDGNYFYVADTGTHRVVKVSPQGEVISTWGSGKMGSGKNEFNNPRSVKVDAKGNIYVADFENSRVQVLGPAGKFVMMIKVGDKVTDVAVDAAGRIFASSMDGNFVKVFSPSGKYLGNLKDAKGSDAPFRGVSGMDFTPDGVLLLSGNDMVYMVRVP